MHDKVLITGAGGCIGAWAIWHLIDCGITPIAFDLTDNRTRPALLHDDAKATDSLCWETGDIADPARLDFVIQKYKPTAIIHLAALQVPFCKASPIDGARVNVVGTINVLEMAKKHDIGCITYASSVAADAMDSGGQWLETLYGAYKVCNEQTARVYWNDYGVASVGIRPSVVYGAARDQGMSALPTVAMLAACVNVPYNIPFCGAVGFVYAAQAAAAFVQAIMQERKGAVAFNLNGCCVTVEEVIAQIKQRLPHAQITCSGDSLPFPSELSDAPLREHIGAYREYSFAEGLAQTLDLFTRRLNENRIQMPND